MAAKAAPYVLGALRLFGGSPKVDWTELMNFSRSLQPTGYLLPTDYAAAGALRSRLSGASTEAARGLRLEALRRLRQRGIDLAPATEATLGRIGEREALGHEQAGSAAEEYLSNLRLGREKFEQGKAMSVLNARLGQAGADINRRALRDTTFFNSLLELTPSILGGIDKLQSGQGYSNQDLGWSNEDLGID